MLVCSFELNCGNRPLRQVIFWIILSLFFTWMKCTNAKFSGTDSVLPAIIVVHQWSMMGGQVSQKYLWDENLRSESNSRWQGISHAWDCTWTNWTVFVSHKFEQDVIDSDLGKQGFLCRDLRYERCRWIQVSRKSVVNSRHLPFNTALC